MKSDKNKIRTVVVKIHNEVDITLSNLTQIETNKLSEKFAVYKKNYYYSPLYKKKSASGKRVWDGKLRFFQNNNKSYLNLLPEILRIITKDFKLKFKIIDKRPKKKAAVDEVDKYYLSEFKDKNGDSIVLHEDQLEAINSFLRCGRGAIVVGTGGGKTYITGAIAKRYNEIYGHKILVITPTITLMKQTAKEIGQLGIKTSILHKQKRDLNVDCVVTTWQTLKNRLDVTSYFDCVLLDEAHGIKGPTLGEMLKSKAFNHVRVRGGLTGTLPPEPDGLLTFRALIGEELCNISARSLMDKGWLADVLIEFLIIKQDFGEIYEMYLEQCEKEGKPKNEILNYDSFKERISKDYDSEKQFLNSSETRLEYISDFIKSKTVKHGNSFVLVNSKPMGRALAEILKFKHENTVFMDVAKEFKDDKKKFEHFGKYETMDDVITITTFHFASTGLNIPRIMNLFMIDAGRGFIRVVQSLGRSTRKGRNKERAYVWDISNELKYSTKHRKERQKHMKKEGHKFKINKVSI